MTGDQGLEVRGDPETAAFFDRMSRHMPRVFIAVMSRLPSDPRCRLCRAPYGGIGGRIMRRIGFAPSRKNPNLCSTCFERAPMGGAEMEIGVLFADVRGFTTLAEAMAPKEVANLLNRFYASASRVLSRSAVIDKLVGDEVMALYLPPLLGDRWEDEMLRDASELLAAVGFAEDPWLPLGVGLDVGRAFAATSARGKSRISPRSATSSTLRRGCSPPRSRARSSCRNASSVACPIDRATPGP